MIIKCVLNARCREVRWPKRAKTGFRRQGFFSCNSHPTANYSCPQENQGLALLIWPSTVWEYLRPVLSNQTRQVCLQGPEPRRYQWPYIRRLGKAPTTLQNDNAKENNFLAHLPNASASKCTFKFLGRKNAQKQSTDSTHAHTQVASQMPKISDRTNETP